MVKKCKICGKEFRTYPCKVKAGRGKYCSRECSLKITSLTGSEGINTRFIKGQKCWKFKGWRYVKSRKNGRLYIQLYKPGWPTSDKNGYIREHRYIMECYLKRSLLPNEVVHHKDGNSLNNNITNLEVMAKKEHDRMNVSLNIHRRWICWR